MKYVMTHGKTDKRVCNKPCKTEANTYAMNHAKDKQVRIEFQSNLTFKKWTCPLKNIHAL